MDNKILDLHTHRQPPYPQGVISVEPKAFNTVAGQYYSVGIHPWETLQGVPPELYRQLDIAAESPQTLAIGECGVDIVKGGPMFRQLQVFKHHFELSERLRKPMVVHCVKAYDVILGLKRDLQPTQPWIIHGFRGKPAAARMLVEARIGVSFGEKFNPESVKSVPDELIFAETDESPLPIEEIISALSECAGHDLTPAISANTSRLFPIDQKR